MKRPPLPYLLLLPLLAVLLFGNCGGGVNSFLHDLQNRGRLARFDSLTQERQRLRLLAKEQLRGRERQEQFYRIEQRIGAQLQPLLRTDWERRKFQNRRNKIERRLRQKPVPNRPVFLPH